MAHIDIDIGRNRYLVVKGDASPAGRDPCDCWGQANRSIYGEIYFAKGDEVYSGRTVAEICLRAINEALRQGQLPSEEDDHA